MFKIIGAVGSMGIGLLILFFYLIGQKEETKAELRENGSKFEKKVLEFDKNMFMNKYFLATKMGNKDEAIYYKLKADEIDKLVEAEEIERLKQKERLDEIKKDTLQIYEDTKKVIADEENKLKEKGGN